MKNYMKIFWFLAFHTKLWLVLNKAWRIRFDKIDWYVRIYDRTKYLVLFEGENVVSFTTGLDNGTR